MKPDIAKKLVQPFDRNKLKKTPQNLDYIPIAEVVARMNEAVGVGRWRVEILDTDSWGQKDTLAGTAPTHIIATVRVHVFDNQFNEWTWCDGMGGQDVGFFNSEHDKWAKYGRKGPEPQGRERVMSPGPLNLGDNYKGACSDATKKALQHLGVGLELARDGVGVEVTEPTADLVEFVKTTVPAAVQASLKANWPFAFKAGMVPIDREAEVRDFVLGFVDRFDQETGEIVPETKSQERSEGGAVAATSKIPEPSYSTPLKPAAAQKVFREYMEAVIGEEQAARREWKVIWTESGYQNTEIGATEFNILLTFIRERLAEYKTNILRDDREVARENGAPV